LGDALNRAEGNGTREQIIAAAGRVFARHGVEKASVTDIVREARVGRATFYKSFSNKEAVFEAVFEREIGEMIVEVRAAVARATDTRSRLKAALLTHTALIREHVNVYRVTLDSLAEMMPLTVWRGQLRHMSEEFLALYGGILQQGVEKGEIAVSDARKTAWLLLLLLKGLFVGSATGDVDDDRESVVDGVVNMIMDGMRPRGVGA
jgi:AcrR family transcriptional regulator